MDDQVTEPAWAALMELARRFEDTGFLDKRFQVMGFEHGAYVWTDTKVYCMFRAPGSDVSYWVAADRNPPTGAEPWVHHWEPQCASNS